MRSDGNLIIAAVAMLVGAALTTVLFIWPNYRQAEALQREADDLHEKIETIEDQARGLEQLNAELLKARHSLGELKSIPTSPDLASLIRKLSQEIDRVTVFDQTFTAGNAADAIVGSEANKPGVQAMPLTVDMESNFEAVFALICNAESLSRLVRITNVRISCKRDDKRVASGESASPLLKSSVSLEAIFDPPLADSGAVASGTAREGR